MNYNLNNIAVDLNQYQGNNQGLGQNNNFTGKNNTWIGNNNSINGN